MAGNSVPIVDVWLSLAVGADALLDAAHDQMVELALRDGTRGVLLTRHSQRRFTFSLSPLVPFGQTEERTDGSPRPDNTLGGPAQRNPAPARDRAFEPARLAGIEK